MKWLRRLFKKPKWQPIATHPRDRLFIAGNPEMDPLSCHPIFLPTIKGWVVCSDPDDPHTFILNSSGAFYDRSMFTHWRELSYEDS